MLEGNDAIVGRAALCDNRAPPPPACAAARRTCMLYRYKRTTSWDMQPKSCAQGTGQGGDAVTKKIRGVTLEENLNNSMGLEFYNLSHRFGYQSPNWPYFEDVKIERIHYHAKSGVLSQRLTLSMHNTTHIDAPAHVVEGTPFIDEVPLPHFFGSGIVI